MNILYENFIAYWKVILKTGTQNHKINTKIQGQTPKKFVQQQMKAFFYCATLLCMLYDTEEKRWFIKNIICLKREITHQFRLCIFFKVNLKFDSSEINGLERLGKSVGSNRNTASLRFVFPSKDSPRKTLIIFFNCRSPNQLWAPSLQAVYNRPVGTELPPNNLRTTCPKHELGLKPPWEGSWSGTLLKNYWYYTLWKNNKPLLNKLT